jgi:membrane fusion protein (multidrug efflux system)
MSSTPSQTAQATPVVPEKRRQRRIPIFIAAGVAVVLLLGFLMVARAGSHVNKVALASLPVGVTAVEAKATHYNSTRHYVGTIRPWVEAKIGPQLTSAYVGSVLVRPGDRVKRGQIIGTLDCRNASAASQGISMQARAIQAQQVALSHEAARIAELKTGGFASDNEIEKKQADSTSKEAELMSTKARLERATLEVSDCVLRSPFDGEVSDRTMDPGAYVHPGESIAMVIDRSTVRVETDVPEEDFDLVKPGVKVDVLALAIGRHVVGTIARRSPAADQSTRTVHFEIDLQDPSRTLPVGTTAELAVASGVPLPAMEIPLAAAAVKGTKATLFLADNGQARKVVVDVLGEKAGRLFVDTSLADKALVITEGRTLLKEGESIQVSVDRLVGIAGGEK